MHRHGLGSLLRVVFVSAILLVGLGAGFFASNELAHPSVQTQIITTTAVSTVTSVQGTNVITNIYNMGNSTIIYNNTTEIQRLQQQLWQLQQRFLFANDFSVGQGFALFFLQQESNFSAILFASNETISVSANSTEFLFSNYGYANAANKYNGTLFLDFWPGSCQSSGSALGKANGTSSTLYILLDSKGGGITSVTFPMTSVFDIYMENTGSSSVSCTYSAVYVYHD